MRIAFLTFAVLIGLSPPIPANAQSDRTLADIRQELSVLYVEIQKLRRELSTTGGASGIAATDSSVLSRLDAIETAVTRLTAQTERIDYRIQRIVEDGTNRIGDLEFRLVELEGGDVSQLGETTTLGGDVTGASVLGQPAGSGEGDTELAVGEEADFKAASAALEAGDFSIAADRFAAFNAAYPGSPLAARASLSRGRALDQLGDTREAARAYLDGFSADPTGPDAPEALTALGAALGRLGKAEQACVTLGEVEARFPTADAVTDARREMNALGCI